MSFATVFILLYGNYEKLHRRCLNSIQSTTPDNTPMHIGLNDVCHNTLDWLESGALANQMLCPGTLNAGNPTRGIEQNNITYFTTNNKNLYKYPMWHRMLYELPKIKTPWIIWVDDDTYFTGDAWWDHIRLLAKKKTEHYLGETWFIHYIKKQWEFITTRPWYCSKPPELINGRPGIHFHTGGFVAARTSTLKQLDWPDQLLQHNGGDTLLAEAMRQNGYKRTHVNTKQFQIYVNQAGRRGYSEKPLGK